MGASNSSRNRRYDFDVFWYCVCPVANKWAVAFDTQCRAFIYDTEGEAIEAALGAAQRNWQRRHVPSGVRVQQGGHWRDLERFDFTEEPRLPKRKHR